MRILIDTNVIYVATGITIDERINLYKLNKLINKSVVYISYISLWEMLNKNIKKEDQGINTIKKIKKKFGNIFLLDEVMEFDDDNDGDLKNYFERVFNLEGEYIELFYGKLTKKIMRNYVFQMTEKTASIIVMYIELIVRSYIGKTESTDIVDPIQNYIIQYTKIIEKQFSTKISYLVRKSNLIKSEVNKLVKNYVKNICFSFQTDILEKVLVIKEESLDITDDLLRIIGLFSLWLKKMKNKDFFLDTEVSCDQLFCRWKGIKAVDNNNEVEVHQLNRLPITGLDQERQKEINEYSFRLIYQEKFYNKYFVGEMSIDSNDFNDYKVIDSFAQNADIDYLITFDKKMIDVLSSCKETRFIDSANKSIELFN